MLNEPSFKNFKIFTFNKKNKENVSYCRGMTIKFVNIFICKNLFVYFNG